MMVRLYHYVSAYPFPEHRIRWAFETVTLPRDWTAEQLAEVSAHNPGMSEITWGNL